MAPLVQAAWTLHYADARLADLPHVAEIVSSFLDGSLLWTPPHAAAHNSPRLFDRVITRVMADPAIDPAFRTHWLARAMQVAIQKNDLVAVQQIHRAHPAPLHVRSLSFALEHGSLALVQWIVSNRSDCLCCAPGVDNLCRMCLVAALPVPLSSHDTDRLIQWLLSMGVTYSQLYGVTPTPSLLTWLEAHVGLNLAHELASLVIGGRNEGIDAARYLLDRGISTSEASVISALASISCQLEREPMVDFLVASRLCDTLRDKFVWAPWRPGSAKVLQWDGAFMNQTLVFGFPMVGNVSSHAAEYCHVDTLIWLWVEHGVAPPRYVRQRNPPSERDLLDLYKWMWISGINNGYCDDDQVCAARNGFLSVIQWLHENEPDQLTTRTMNAAAENGQLEIVQWLHDNCSQGCTDNTLNVAAKKGHLDVVQWLCENQTEGDTNGAMLNAAIGGQLEVLTWLHANRIDSCPVCVLRSVLADPHCCIGGLDTIRWLTNNHASSGNCLGRCVTPRRAHVSVPASILAIGDIDFAQYLLEHHRSSFTVAPANMLVNTGGHLRAIQWLHENAPETVDWQLALEAARRSGNGQVRVWFEDVIGSAHTQTTT